jgi:four helix bundle protein
MAIDELKNRTKQLALRIIRLVESLPNNKTSNILGGQLLRSGTSVGANYRAACRAKPTADFISKLAIVEEEADESIYSVELLVESRQVKCNLVEDLLSEVDEIVSIIVAAKFKQNPRSQIRIPKSV